MRDLPYATDSASEAAGLITRGRGNCLAKADLIWHGFRRLGIGARRVKWRYVLVPHPPEAAFLPVRYDIHTAVEVAIGGAWVLVDATNDPPLASGGLMVAGWPGVDSTAPNFVPSGPIWREDEDEGQIAAALGELAAQYESISAEPNRYLPAFNEWLDSLRHGNGCY